MPPKIRFLKKLSYIVLNTCSSNCPKFLSPLGPGKGYNCEGVGQERNITQNSCDCDLHGHKNEILKPTGKFLNKPPPQASLCWLMASQIQMRPSATLQPPFQCCHWPWRGPTASDLALYSVSVTMFSTQVTEIPSLHWLQQ